MDAKFLRKTIRLAKYAAAKGEVPVGAVVVNSSGVILGAGWNVRERQGSFGKKGGHWICICVCTNDE